jgi:hypothetical protein
MTLNFGVNSNLSLVRRFHTMEKMCQFYSDSSRFFLPTVKHSKRRRKRTKTHVFRKDRVKFVTGLRHQRERDRRYHAREHILVVLVSCWQLFFGRGARQNTRYFNSHYGTVHLLALLLTRLGFDAYRYSQWTNKTGTKMRIT